MILIIVLVVVFGRNGAVVGIIVIKGGDRPVQMFQRIGLHPGRLFGKYLTITGTSASVHAYKTFRMEEKKAKVKIKRRRAVKTRRPRRRRRHEESGV